MNYEINQLQQRIQELEIIAREYARLEHLVRYAAEGQDLGRYLSLSVLYVDPISRQITEVNDATLELLGYSRAELIGMFIGDLEISATPAPTASPDAVNAKVYTAVYRHHAGHALSLTVHQQLLQRADQQHVYYRLEDTSLHRRLWHELQRREDDGFKFQQKLTILNEITIELSHIESFDTLCYQIIRLGVERLGFDRLGLWLVDSEQGMMRGTYGVDEQGNIRAEHHQQWFYTGKHISKFITGETKTPLVFNNSPIYNDKSEIIHYGWQITVPVLYGDHCIATLATDNFRFAQPIHNYEPELLRLYGITVAHLMELLRSREQSIALRIAQERTHMLREFITNIGHDIRMPLTVINNSAYLLQRVTETERRQTLAKGVEQQVTHISRLVDDVLEFVALQSGVKFNRVSISLTALLTSVIQTHQTASEAKNIQIHCDLDTPWVVIADTEHVGRAFSEIIGNAIQYTAADGWVRVSPVAYTREIGIRIQDSGIGMDKDTLTRIFDPLYRGDQARTERRSGLGLAIAKMIVEAHGGRILVNSMVGHGSTFEVVLPR